MVVSHEHIAVDLVDEHLINDVLLQLTCLLDQVPKTHTCALVVLLLGVDYVDQGTAVLDLVSLVTLNRLVSWEVHHVELDVFIVGYRLAFDGYSWQQEEGLMWRHLLEHDFGN